MSKKKDDDKIKLKIYALGNGTVGKTSFIVRFCDNEFYENTAETTGIDFYTKVIKLSNGKKCSVNFYDTAGQERYKSISLNMFKNIDGILLMYDVTNIKTFEAIPQWMKDIKEGRGLDFPIILVGNKIDLTDKRVVKTEEGKNIAKEYGLDFYEVSNKDGTNINKVAMVLINSIVEIKEKAKEETKNIVVLNNNNSDNSKDKCNC